MNETTGFKDWFESQAHGAIGTNTASFVRCVRQIWGNANFRIEGGIVKCSVESEGRNIEVSYSSASVPTVVVHIKWSSPNDFYSKKEDPEYSHDGYNSTDNNIAPELQKGSIKVFKQLKTFAQLLKDHGFKIKFYTWSDRRKDSISNVLSNIGFRQSKNGIWEWSIG